jgi:hypothetical protein
LARLAREHDEGVFYEAATEQIEKWGKEMYPPTHTETSKTIESEQESD